MDSRIQVLNRFGAVAMELALGVFHMFLGAMHRF
jgi:hypothetical protein